MKILVLGAGGTGGYFGGRLVESGADVTFLVRAHRLATLEDKGLRIESVRGNAKLNVKALTAEQIEAPFDLVILSCKAYDLASAIEAIRPAVGPDTFILPILNGLQHYRSLEQAFSPKQVLGGLVYISATMGGEGQIIHLNAGQKVVFGPRLIEQRDACQKILAVFQTSSFDAMLAENIMREAWAKYVFLCSLAAITCLMRGSVGEIMATRHGEALLRQVLAECEGVAEAEGYSLIADVHADLEKQLTEKGSPVTASMFRDLKNNSRVEADAIVGDMIARGNAKGRKLPLLQTAYSHLQVYQAQWQYENRAKV